MPPSESSLRRKRTAVSLFFNLHTRVLSSEGVSWESHGVRECYRGAKSKAHFFLYQPKPCGCSLSWPMCWAWPIVIVSEENFSSHPKFSFPTKAKNVGGGGEKISLPTPKITFFSVRQK
jgi:hypothetical protein